MLRRVALVRTDGVFFLSVHQLLVTANIPSSPILVTLMMEALCSSETSVLTRATWRIPEDAILQGYILILRPGITFLLLHITKLLSNNVITPTIPRFHWSVMRMKGQQKHCGTATQNLKRETAVNSKGKVCMP
jgi:hypothetical protein